MLHTFFFRWIFLLKTLLFVSPLFCTLESTHVNQALSLFASPNVTSAMEELVQKWIEEAQKAEKEESHCFLMAVQDHLNGKIQQKIGDAEAIDLFERSALQCEALFRRLKGDDHPFTERFFIAILLNYLAMNNPEADQKIHASIQRHQREKNDSPFDELYRYFSCYATARLLLATDDPLFKQRLFIEAHHCLQHHPQGFYTAEILYLLGWISEHNDAIEESKVYYTRCFEEHQESFRAPFALFRKARLLHGEGALSEAHLLFHRCYHSYPNSPITPVAYFEEWRLKKNLHLTPMIEQQLHHFRTHYPKSPWKIALFFIFGMVEKERSQDFLHAATLFGRKIDDVLHDLTIDPWEEDSNLYLLQLEARLEEIDCYQRSLKTLKDREHKLCLLSMEEALQKGEEQIKKKKIWFKDTVLQNLEERLHSYKINFNLMQNDVEKAEFIFTQLCQANSKAIAAKNIAAHYRKKGVPERALSYLDEVEIDQVSLPEGELLDFYLETALTHHQLRNYEKAERAASLAIELPFPSSRRLDAMALRAMILIQQEKTVDAQRQIAQLKAMGGVGAMRRLQQLPI